jgi:hypothetical protein
MVRPTRPTQREAIAGQNDHSARVSSDPSIDLSADELHGDRIDTARPPDMDDPISARSEHPLIAAGRVVADAPSRYEVDADGHPTAHRCTRANESFP